MLRSAKEFNEYTLYAADGAVGPVTDLYFDDENWVIGYLAAGPGRLLLAPANLAPLNETGQVLSTSLARERLRQDAAGESLHPISKILGYRIQARDGEIGSLADFIIDDETWTIQYMIIDTGNFLAGRQVRLAASWVQQVNWEDAEIQVDLAEETISNSPDYVD